MSPPVQLQRTFWNRWNASNREKALGRASLEQAEAVTAWLRRLNRADLDIIDVGCGAGWLCTRLTPFGRVTGTDLSGEVVDRARARAPEVEFISSDFMDLELGSESFDVVVCLEMLSHVSDQVAFLRRGFHLWRPGGWLMLGTQNRPALERSRIPPPGLGQLRRWVDRHELSVLLQAEYRVVEMFSITPIFNRGPLRLLSSGRLQRVAATLRLHRPLRAVVRMAEKKWLGWTLMALATRRG